jgi:branched-chain amino acid transport system substrate-binding protein
MTTFDVVAELCQHVGAVLRERPDISQAELAAIVETKIAASRELKLAFESDKELLQINKDGATGHQTVIAGGTVYFGGTHISQRTAEALAAALKRHQSREGQGVSFWKYLHWISETCCEWWRYVRTRAQMVGGVSRLAIDRAVDLAFDQRVIMFILGTVFTGVVFLVINLLIVVFAPTPVTPTSDRSEINRCSREGSQHPVTVGAIYPLSKPAGKRAQVAINLATEIINDDFRGLLLGNDRRFCIKVDFRDSNSKPYVAAQAARDLKNKNVVALNGAYESSVTESVRDEAEKLKIPFLNGESVANLTEKDGLEWFFHTTPVATQIASMYTGFLKEQTVNKIAIVYDNDRYGLSVAPAVKKALGDGGLNITLYRSYPTPLSDEVASKVVKELKDKKPDVVMFMSYLDEAGEFATQMEKLTYKPPMMIADEAGFSEPDFLCKFGDKVEGVLTRSSWIVGDPGTVPYRVNEMYKNKSGGIDLDSITARTMQGFMVLAGAINRAQSTAPDAIQKALRDTNLDPEQLIAHYAGVKFNPKGENTMGSVLLTQLQDRNGLKYVPVWPKEATKADTNLRAYTGFRDWWATPATKPKCPPPPEQPRSE